MAGDCYFWFVLFTSFTFSGVSVDYFYNPREKLIRKCYFFFNHMTFYLFYFIFKDFIYLFLERG